ncbi:MAG: phosphorylase [Aphanothece sp. CMT-3BRIN-NPC111]|jgi:hypothetical protein|nr:phosphorylase [Aphanothece sp. CMT-3BRIN-NPC111]
MEIGSDNHKQINILVNLNIHVILVPQGVEYQAVCRGVSCITAPKPLVVPIPIGVEPLTKYLETWQHAGGLLNYPQPQVLLMGLCGSLSPNYAVGDMVIYQNCVYKSNTSQPELRSCDRELTTKLHHTLKERATLVQGLTSDRLIWSADEKRQLGQIYNADVVDMEGFAALKVLNQAGVAVAMLRVVSDGCDRDLPNLTSAFSSTGTLQPLPLAIGMIRQPLAATRLIQGSLKGLKVLQKVIEFLYN